VIPGEPSDFPPRLLGDETARSPESSGILQLIFRILCQGRAENRKVHAVVGLPENRKRP